jgi:hypothetical protein
MKNTKMAAALSKAVHEAIDRGDNAGRIGRIVLTHEASMRVSNRASKFRRNGVPADSAARSKQYGSIDGVLLALIIVSLIFTFIGDTLYFGIAW